MNKIWSQCKEEERSYENSQRSFRRLRSGSVEVLEGGEEVSPSRVAPKVREEQVRHRESNRITRTLFILRKWLDEEEYDGAEALAELVRDVGQAEGHEAVHRRWARQDLRGRRQKESV